jgi:hypothetical protein
LLQGKGKKQIKIWHKKFFSIGPNATVLPGLEDMLPKWKSIPLARCREFKI